MGENYDMKWIKSETIRALLMIQQGGKSSKEGNKMLSNVSEKLQGNPLLAAAYNHFLAVLHHQFYDLPIDTPVKKHFMKSCLNHSKQSLTLAPNSLKYLCFHVHLLGHEAHRSGADGYCSMREFCHKEVDIKEVQVEEVDFVGMLQDVFGIQPVEMNYREVIKKLHEKVVIALEEKQYNQLRDWPYRPIFKVKADKAK